MGFKMRILTQRLPRAVDLVSWKGPGALSPCASGGNSLKDATMPPTLEGRKVEDPNLL